MNKSKTFYDFCKISVDDAELINGEYHCWCITPGTPDELEPRAFQRIITLQELKYHVSGTKGMVEVPCNSDPAETDRVTFNEWLSTQTTMDLFPYFNTIINNAEERHFEYGKQSIDISLINAIEDGGFRIKCSEWYAPVDPTWIKWVSDTHRICIDFKSKTISGYLLDGENSIFLLSVGSAPLSDMHLFGLLVSLDFIMPKTTSKAA